MTQPAVVAPPGPANLLEVRRLGVTFGAGGNAVAAVRDVSFELAAGRTHAFVGESGCGKSTTLLSLLRLLPAHASVGGSVQFAGTELTAMSEKQLRAVRGGAIGIVFQHPLSSLNPVVKIGTQLIEALRLHRPMRHSAARARAADYLGLVGIPDPRSAIDRYPHEFSGGMRQRVMIAAALICEPAILLADEPTSALDVTVQAQILDLLRRLRDELQLAVVIVTHDVGVVAELVTTVHVMYAGRIVESGPTEEVLAAPAHPYTQAMLESVARLDQPRMRSLRAIAGSPPRLDRPIVGCAFAPRCPRVEDRCTTERPPLGPVRRDAIAACWNPVETPGES